MAARRQASAGFNPRPASPGFLIHDSTIFDGVDERQRAEALELAASESQAHGFQYICTLNSDDVPRNEFFLDTFRVFGSFANQMEQAPVSSDGPRWCR